MKQNCGYTGGYKKPKTYKEIELWSSYGLVKVPVAVLNNDLVVLENYVNGVVVKVVDAPPQKLPFHVVKHYSGSMVDIRANKIFGEYVEKQKLYGTTNMRIQTQLEPLSGVDIHFLTNQYMEFLKKELNIDCPTNNGIVLSLHKIRNLDNAFFTGEYMIYGLGGRQMVALGKADVVGHELGHAIVNDLSGLEYKSESGALNEHFADVLGVVFEFWLYKKFNEDDDPTNDISGEADWTMGEEIMKLKPFMRSFENPNLGNQPQSYKGPFWAQTNNLAVDNGGVHINSGVPNHCFYLTCQKINIYDACRLWIKTLATLSPTCDMEMFATKLKLCADSEQISVVTEALKNVGL